ncbi:MAG: hypothetical protein MJE68_07090, partial [Proteobacteria bacterium]|nr:hypothetical protein [Pseudomonadota bacterium]
AYFQKMSKSCLPNPQEVGGPLSKQFPSSCIKSTNNHVEKMTKQMIAKGAKRIGKARRISFVLLTSFSSHVHCTSPTPSHVQLWAERQRELSARVLQRGAVVITKKCGDHEIFTTKISIMGFSAISRNSEARKFGAVYGIYHQISYFDPFCMPV